MDPVELDHLINLLKSELEAGRVMLNSSELVNSLSKVRTGLDGKVDPVTVDGSVRALARAVAAGKSMREQRESMSLQEVQAAYFDSLSEMFGDVFQEMQRRNANPQIIAEVFASVSGELDLLEHAAHLFNQKFSSADELLKFISKYNDPATLLGQIADPSRVLFDAEWSGSLADQFARWNSELAPLMGSKLSSAEKFYRFLFGRMGQANDILFRSNRYVGTPLVDAPTSWQYLLWKYEYDGRRTSTSGDMKNLVISKAVQVEGRNELGMLAGVPPETLIRLRKEGALANLREILSKGIGEIDSASSMTLTEVADKVIENVDAAFSAHDRDLKDLSSSKRKFYGFDIGRWVAIGGLSIAAAALESRGLAILATASTAILGSPAGPDLKKRWEELRDTKQKLERSPTGMLFRHLKGKFGF